MAKKDRTPSLTWERVQAAILKTSLNVERIPGTGMLLVNEGRVRLTWVEKDKKKHTRIRLRRKYLNPRWIEIPKDYPISLEDLRNTGDTELASKGIIKTGEGKFKLLIYQQLDDLYSLRRQFINIKPQYEHEEEMLWEKFTETLFERSLEPDYIEDIFERLDEIGTIKAHLSGREKAVRVRIQGLVNTQKHIYGAVKKLLDLVPKSNKDKNVRGTITGLSKSLERCNTVLIRLLKDEPFHNRARWSRYHITCAIKDLELSLKYLRYSIGIDRHLDDIRYHLKKAVAHLSVYS